MLNFSFERSEGFTGFLNLNGELTAVGAGRLKEALIVSLDNAEHLIVNLANVTKIDDVCIRLFGIACKKSKRLKKKLTLTGIEPEIVNRIKQTTNQFHKINMYEGGVLS